jgi:transcriptional regulator with XRE-family HTH domain
LSKNGGEIMQYSEFGVRIRAQMLRKGIKGTQLSKQLGISNAYLSDILRGSRDGVKYRPKIAEILGIPDIQKQAG